MTQAPVPSDGSLASVPLPELLATYARAKRSGRLVIQTRVGQAEVRLFDGSVVEARFGPAHGETALLRLMTFQEGSFSFEAQGMPAGSVTSGALADILLKAGSHQAEVERYAAQLGGLNECFVLDTALFSKRMHDVPPEIGPILRLVDGKRAVRDILALTDLPDTTVLRVLRKLRGMALLRTRAEVEREAAEAAARAEAAKAPVAPPTLDEMLLQQFARQADERAALLQLAVPPEFRSVPTTSAATQAALDAFVGPPGASLLPEPAKPERTKTPPAGTPVAAAAESSAPLPVMRSITLPPMMARAPSLESIKAAAASQKPTAAPSTMVAAFAASALTPKTPEPTPAAPIKSAETAPRPAEVSAKAAEVGPRPAEVGAKAAEEGPPRAEVGAKAAEEGPPRAEVGAGAAEDGPKSAEVGAVASEAGPKPAEVSAKAAEAGPKPPEEAPKASEAGPKPAELSAQAAEVAPKAAEPAPVATSAASILDEVPPVPAGDGRTKEPSAERAGPGKDSVRLRSSASGAAEPVVVRWTDGPGRTFDGEDEPADPGSASGWDGANLVTPISTPSMSDLAAASGPAVAPAAPEDGTDSAFFAKAANPSALSDLAAEADEAEIRRDGGRKFFAAVGLVVAGLTVAAVGVVYLGSPPPPPEVAEPPPPPPAEPARPNVVATEQEATVKTGEQALAEIGREEATRLAPVVEDLGAKAETPEPAAAPTTAASSAQPTPTAAPAAKPEPVAAPGEPVKTPAPTMASSAAPPRVAAAPAPARSAEEPRAKPEPRAAEPAADVSKEARAREQFAALYDKGIKLLNQQRYEEAKKAFEGAMKADPNDARVFTSLGQVDYELGQLDPALKMLRRSEALNRNYAPTYLVMGLVQQERGDLDAAEKAFQRYLTLETTGPNAKAVQGFLKALQAQRAQKK